MVHGVLKGNLAVIMEAFGGGAVVNSATAFDGDTMEGVLSHEKDVFWGEPVTV